MKPAPIDYDIVREMLRTATPDRILRFIGKSHPADIALLFKGLQPFRCDSSLTSCSPRGAPTKR